MNWGNIFKTTGIVVGIVQDFHLRSLHHEIEPLALRMHLDKVGPGGHARHLVARLRPENVPATLQFLRDKLAEFAPSQHFGIPFWTPILISMSYIKRDAIDARIRHIRRIGSFFSLSGVVRSCALHDGESHPGNRYPESPRRVRFQHRFNDVERLRIPGDHCHHHRMACRVFRSGGFAAELRLSGRRRLVDVPVVRCVGARAGAVNRWMAGRQSREGESDGCSAA